MDYFGIDKLINQNLNNYIVRNYYMKIFNIILNRLIKLLNLVNDNMKREKRKKKKEYSEFMIELQYQQLSLDYTVEL